RFVYRVPMKSLIEPITTDVRLRRLVTNMIYVGVLGELLGIPEQEVEKALDAQLGKKPKALALNHAAVRAGWEWARQNLTKRDPFRLERMDKSGGKVLIDGNTAGALRAVMGGASVATADPIPPSARLLAAMI